MKEKEDHLRNFPLVIQKLRERTILLEARLRLNNTKKGGVHVSKNNKIHSEKEW